MTYFLDVGCLTDITHLGKGEKVSCHGTLLELNEVGAPGGGGGRLPYRRGLGILQPRN